MCPAQISWLLGPSRTQGCPCAFPGIFGAQGIRGHWPQMQSLKRSVEGGLAKGDLKEVIHKSLWLLEAKITWGSEEVLLDEQKPTAGRRVLAFPAPPQRAQAESQGGGGPGQRDPPWRLSPAGMGACLGSGLWLWVTPSLLGPQCSHPPREPPATHQEATNHSGQVPQLPAGHYLILGSAPYGSCLPESTIPPPYKAVTEPPPPPHMNLHGLKEGFVTCARLGESAINNLWLLSTKGPCQHFHSSSEKEGSIYGPMLPPGSHREGNETEECEEKKGLSSYQAKNALHELSHARTRYLITHII